MRRQGRRLGSLIVDDLGRVVERPKVAGCCRIDHRTTHPYWRGR
jgi:hypothetical protein